MREGPCGEPKTLFGPYTLAGNLCSKANSRRLVAFGGRPRVIKSARAMNWLDSASWQLKRPARPISGPLALICTVYYDSMRPDLDISLLMDFLQKQGVYENDRQVWHIEATRTIDKENPRVVFRLDEFQESK